MALSKTPVFFGRFVVTSQVFHLTSHSMALVNLKPLLPGHVLVCPRRVAPRLADLTSDEISDLFLTVQCVSRVVERVYKASGLNIAIQDGADAGQSVPHVHTHIVPRQKADLDEQGGSDALYGMLEGEEGNLGKHHHEMWEKRPGFPVVDDRSRVPRSEDEMMEEANMLASEMQKQQS